MRRLKVLLSAYCCLPGRGSEPGIGWNTARVLAEHHDVWVLTRRSNQAALERELAARPIPSLRFIYVDTPAWLGWYERFYLGINLHYHGWQLASYAVARRAHRRIRFDLAHHVSFVRYWTPSFLALLPIPFVWGPVAGKEPLPRAFFTSFGAAGRVQAHARQLVMRAADHDPWVRRTARGSALALATSEETAAHLRRLGARRALVLTPTAAPDDVFALPPPAPRAPGDALRFMSVGGLLHWKGYHLAIRALAAAGLPDARYDIVGSGPERRALGALAARCGVAQQVSFHEISRAEMLGMLNACDVFLHPALHEGGATATVEAMAVGKPVIYLDAGGTPLQVGAGGIGIPPTTVEETVAGLAAAMRRLAGDAALRCELGQAGKQRALEHFSWEARGEQLCNLYATVIHQEQVK